MPVLIFSGAEWRSFLSGKACHRVRSTKRPRRMPRPANRHKHLCVVSSRRFSLLRSPSSLSEVKPERIHPHKHRHAKDIAGLAAAGEMQAHLN